MAKTVHIREEIVVPDNVDVVIDGLNIKVRGVKGEIQRSFSYAKGIQMRLENGKIVLETFFADREKKALLYSIAAHIRNIFSVYYTILYQPFNLLSSYSSRNSVYLTNINLYSSFTYT